MSQQARVTGAVQYREGDGPLLTIRKGPIEVESTEHDVVLSWSEAATDEQSAEVRSRAALPMDDYQRFVAEGAIVEST